MSDEPAQYPYPVDMVIHALNEAGGVFLGAAAKLGCDRATIERYVENLPPVQEALSRIDIQNADLAQIAFLKAVSEGKPWAVERAVSSRAHTGRPPRSVHGSQWGHCVIPPELEYPPGATEAERAVVRRLRADFAERVLLDVATSGEHPATRALAAAKLHDIVEPKVNRNLNLNVNLDGGDVRDLADDDLQAELARLGGAGAADPAGDAPPPLPPPLSHLRH